MKKLLFLLSVFTIILSCSNDETPPPAPIVKYTITLSAGEGGTVSTTGGEYEAGQTVSVTATPQGEYLFKDWSDGNTNATRTITVSSNSTLTANFEKKKYPLTVNIEGEGEVLEEIVNAGRTTDYNSGTTVKLTAVPAEGWEFVGWEGAINGSSNPQQLLINELKTVTATFEDNILKNILGKWDFETDTSYNKGNSSANPGQCELVYIIFNSDLSFKLYIQNAVITGSFSSINGSIELKVEDETIGFISEIEIKGTELTAEFNLPDYCIKVIIANKQEDYIEGYTYVPDDNFEQALIDYGYDNKLDDYVSTSNINSITSLNLNAKNISNLTGIEDFKSLVQLLVNKNNLSSVNVSKNLLLNYLELSENKISSIDLSANEYIEHLNLTNNQLNAIDLSANTLLAELFISKNNIDTLDISSIQSLISFNSKDNENLFCVKVNEFQLANIPIGWEVDSITSINTNCSNICGQIFDDNIFSLNYTSFLNTFDSIGEIDIFNRKIYIINKVNLKNDDWKDWFEGQYGVRGELNMIQLAFNKTVENDDVILELFYDSLTEDFLMVRVRLYNSEKPIKNSCTNFYHFVKKRYLNERTKTIDFSNNCQALYFDCFNEVFDFATSYLNLVKCNSTVDLYDLNYLSLKGKFDLGEELVFGEKLFKVESFYDSIDNQDWREHIQRIYGIPEGVSRVTLKALTPTKDGHNYKMDLWYNKNSGDFLYSSFSYSDTEENIIDSCTDSKFFVRKILYFEVITEPNFNDSCQSTHYDCIEDLFQSSVSYSNSL